MTSAGLRAPIDFDRLLEALKRGDDSAVLAMFFGRSEPERRRVAPKLFRLRRQGWVDGPGGQTLVSTAYSDTACAALFACGTLSEIKKLSLEHQFGMMCHDLTYKLLVDRRPHWLTAWAAWALDHEATPSGHAGGLWELVRRLIKAGVCEPLDTDGYILGMVFGIRNYKYNLRDRWHAGARDDAAIEHHFEKYRKRTVVDALRDDPDLLQNEVWRIFEVPGRPSRQLGLRTVNHHDWWIYPFVALSASGELDRTRVQKATLDALARDITQYQAKWFISLWRCLGPRLADRQQCQERLLHLLSHRVPVVVQFALEQLDSLADSGVLDAATFVAEAEGVLLTMPVATARHALRLLDRVSQAEPSVQDAAMVAVTAALLHANAGVRDAAVKFLTERARSSGTSVTDAIEANLNALTPAQVTRLRALSA